MSSLWGIKKNDLKSGYVEGPSKIIKEQIEEFDKIANGTLYGNLTGFRIQEPDCEYPLGTSFEIIAPNLNGYHYRVFTMYTDPIQDYPVLIYDEYDSDIYEITEVTADYVCKDEEGFIDVIKIILQSEKVTKIVKTLYGKSNI